MTTAADLPAVPAADTVYKSAAILALIPDEVSRYLARCTGTAVVDGVQIAVYDPTLCDWVDCGLIPEPVGRRFCREHRDAHTERVRARLIADARASRERQRDLLAGLRRTAYDEMPLQVPQQRAGTRTA